MTRPELLARIHVLLGGRVAEEMIFGDVSTGAQNDLQKATEIARTMTTQFGMSDRLGLVALEGSRTPIFLPVPTSGPKEYSEETARIVDEEIKTILSEAHAKARTLLAAHQQALEELAKLLLDKEVIERPQLQAILNNNNAAGSGQRSQTLAPDERERILFWVDSAALGRQERLGFTTGSGNCLKSRFAAQSFSNFCFRAAMRLTRPSRHPSRYCFFPLQ
jgi:hypothetical protein